MSRWRPPPVRSLRLTRRGLLLLGAQAGIMGALAWRMRALQVEDAQRYRLLAEENRINIRLLPPARGQIFDRNGAPLAVNSQNYRVVLIREQAGDVEDTLDRLGRLIRIEPHERERVLRDIRRKSSFVPVTVTEHLDWEDFARVNANAPALPGRSKPAALYPLHHRPDLDLRRNLQVGRPEELRDTPGDPHAQREGLQR